MGWPEALVQIVGGISMLLFILGICYIVWGHPE